MFYNLRFKLHTAIVCLLLIILNASCDNTFDTSTKAYHYAADGVVPYSIRDTLVFLVKEPSYKDTVYATDITLEHTDHEEFKCCGHEEYDYYEEISYNLHSEDGNIIFTVVNSAYNKHWNLSQKILTFKLYKKDIRFHVGNLNREQELIDTMAINGKAYTNVYTKDNKVYYNKTHGFLKYETSKRSISILSYR